LEILPRAFLRHSFLTLIITAIAIACVKFSNAQYIGMIPKYPAGAVSGGGMDYASLDISGQDFSSQNYKGKDFTQVRVLVVPRVVSYLLVQKKSISLTLERTYYR